ncbi:MAG: hypothetical protein Q4G67_13745 [Actinomycetia bacterium]|nr:hypothetical protein [Actinomycetes bacterium]
MLLFVAGPAMASESLSATGPESGETALGVEPGVEHELVPSVAFLEDFLGPRPDSPETGNVNAYSASFDEELNVGYIAVSKDQWMTREATRAAITASGASSADDQRHVIVFSRYSADEIDMSMARMRERLAPTSFSGTFGYDPASDKIQLVGSFTGSEKLDVNDILNDLLVEVAITPGVFESDARGYSASLLQ